MIDLIATGISLLCMIGSFISFLIAQRQKRSAKASEEQAKIYAADANKANLAAKEYYDTILEIIQQEEPERERAKEKERARRFIAQNGVTKTQEVANYLNIEKNDAFLLLEEMLKVDGTISCGGQCHPNNIDKVIWIKK